MSMRTSDVYTYREPTWAHGDISGFEIEARDGSIGKIDKATNETGNSCLVVDTGPWIFGKKVMLPAGVVRDIDVDSQTVFLDLTKDEIKNAPEYDESMENDTGYRDQLGSYYGAGMNRDRS
jgi:hypothetical protein